MNLCEHGTEMDLRCAWCTAWAGKYRAGDARSEADRRARVVRGWAFRGLTGHCEAEIRRYLAGGPTPVGYERLHGSTR